MVAVIDILVNDVNLYNLVLGPYITTYPRITREQQSVCMDLNLLSRCCTDRGAFAPTPTPLARARVTDARTCICSIRCRIRCVFQYRNYPANRFYRDGIAAWIPSLYGIQAAIDRFCVVMYACTDKHQTPVRGM